MSVQHKSAVSLSRLALIGAALLASLPAFATGGVSGGGGNVLFPLAPKIEASTSFVRGVIEQSHELVVKYLREKKAAFNRGTLSAAEREEFALLFQQPRDVLVISFNERLEIESQRPCVDANALPVDADVRGDFADRVCVSSFALSKKLEKNRLPAESAALLVHEFSELAGFEEDDAVRIQNLVLKDFEAK
jgi:hypothetical protein